MRNLLTWTLSVTLLVLLPGTTAADKGAARLYSGNCNSCHLVPDRAFASDRAWVGQIMRTA